VLYLDTFAFWQTDPWLLPPNHKDIALPCSKRVVYRILDMHNVETSIVTFPMRYYTHTTHVTSTSSHSNDSGIETDKIDDLPCGQVDLDSVVDLDCWVRVPNSKNITSFRQYISARILPKLGPTTESMQQTYVRASCVTKNGIPPLPSCTLLTFANLYSASSVVMRWTVKRPLVS